LVASGVDSFVDDLRGFVGLFSFGGFGLCASAVVGVGRYLGGVGMALGFSGIGNRAGGVIGCDSGGCAGIVGKSGNRNQDKQAQRRQSKACEPAQP
jgi:hypothetical protein